MKNKISTVILPCALSVFLAAGCASSGEQPLPSPEALAGAQTINMALLRRASRIDNIDRTRAMFLKVFKPGTIYRIPENCPLRPRNFMAVMQTRFGTAHAFEFSCLKSGSHPFLNTYTGGNPGALAPRLATNQSMIEQKQAMGNRVTGMIMVGKDENVITGVNVFMAFVN